MIRVKLKPSVDTRTLRRLQDFMRNPWKRYMAKELGQEALEIHKRRLRYGVDVNHAPFAPYSKRHAERRRKKGLPTSLVNLNFSSRMVRMDWLEKTVKNNEGSYSSVLYFKTKRSQRIADIHNKGLDNMPTRRFLGFKERGADFYRIQNLAYDILTRRLYQVIRSA